MARLEINPGPSGAIHVPGDLRDTEIEVQFGLGVRNETRGIGAGQLFPTNHGISLIPQIY
jgi:hypothetical protein